MKPMTTVSQVLNVLKERGYTEEFNLKETCIVSQNGELSLSPDQFEVDKHYRFEGQSDPGDSAIVYAISSKETDVKGTLVDGYGMYSETLSKDMIEALKQDYKNEDLRT